MNIQILVPNKGELIITRTEPKEFQKFVHYVSPSNDPKKKKSVFELIESEEFKEAENETPYVVGIYMEKGGNKGRATDIGRREADKFLHPERYGDEEELKRLEAQMAAVKARMATGRDKVRPTPPPPANTK
ncbi:MAG: hypothetical protein DMF68_13670 [Acidobacteria bacterium]|nr:MAG: hypothetical protein DMF68_13670 [Acidobacteriota bacterium]